MEFTLNIALGNDAVQTGDDVAALLRRVASQIEGATLHHGFGVDGLQDVNGNTVGRWEVIGGGEKPYTVYFAVHTTAASPLDAVNDVEARLARVERQAEAVGLVFATHGITDENGEDVTFEVRP